MDVDSIASYHAIDSNLKSLPTLFVNARYLAEWKANKLTIVSMI